jgi:IS5 family transposase
MQLSLLFPEVNCNTPKKEFYEKMNKILPIQRWINMIRPSYFANNTKGGQTPKNLEIMIRTMIVKHSYSYSNVACEAEIWENLTVRKFVGIEKEKDIPDESTICRFHNFLINQGYYTKMFEEDVKELEQDGYILRTGTVVDSAIIHSSTSKKNKDKKRDEEAGWTKKANNWHFGYKGHIGVDDKYGLIHTNVLTAGNKADVVVAEKCLHGKEKRAEMDSGYLGVKNHIKDKNKKKIKMHIMKRRSSVKNMSTHKQARQKVLEKKKASIRCKVEHAFGVMKRKFGWNYTYLKGIKKNSETFSFKCTLANYYLLSTRQCFAEIKG